jgi:hypothetical protein
MLTDEDEFTIAWAHDYLDIEKIIAMTEDCSKECCSCSRDDKEDCRLELRECMHSLAKIVKSAILSIVDASTKERPMLPEKPVEPLYS